MASNDLGGQTTFVFQNVYIKSFPKWCDPCLLDENCDSDLSKFINFLGGLERNWPKKVTQWK